MFQAIRRTYSIQGALINLGIIILFLLMLYHYRYGLGMLNPVNDAWVMKHDWATHHLSWFFYRFEPWSFPIGKVTNYLYPGGTNVGFTDSIPLAAIFFKIFSPILPKDFQYLGIWLFMCHVLVAFFAIKVFEQFSVKGIVQLMAVLIVVFNPVLLHRSIHPALCSHWLIIGSIWVYFLNPKQTSPTRLLTYQGLFLLIGGLINPYFSIIESGFLVALAWRLWGFDRMVSFLKASVFTVGPLVILFASWFAIGFFEFTNRGDLSVTGGYGLYAFNLNSFYNSGGWSSLYPGFPLVSWHQYESFMYLGAGMIGLLLFALVGAVVERLWKGPSNTPPHLAHIIPLAFFVIVISLFAITNVVTWNDHVLFQFPIPRKLLKVGEVFRASARFFWVAYYLLFFVGLLISIRLIRRVAILAPLLIMVFIIQLYDYKLFLGSEHIESFHSYHPPIHEASWRAIIEKMDRVEFYPPFGTTYLKDADYRYFCYLAADCQKPINLGYAARNDSKSMNHYTEELKRNIDQGTIDANTLFITTPDFVGRFLDLYQRGRVGYGQLDGYCFFYPMKLSNDPAFANFVNKAPGWMSEKKVFAPFELGKSDQETDLSIVLNRLERSSRNIFLRGWLPIDLSKNANSYSIVLTSETSKVFKSAPVVLANDSLSLGKNGVLDSIVFAGTYFLDGLMPGNYEIGLYLESLQENKSGFYNYFGNISVGSENVFQPKERPQAPKLRCWLDVFEESDNEIEVRGWAFIEGQSTSSNRIEIELKSDDKIYYVPTDPDLRPDLTPYFNSSHNLITGGFISFISKKGLKKGNYELGIRVINDKTHQDGVQYMGRYITIE